MTNLRILYDNVADDATGIGADSEASADLVVEQTQNDYKGKVLRSVGTSLVITWTWTTVKQVGGLFFLSNLTASGTARLQLFSDEACTASIGDTTALTAAPGLNISLWKWTEPINANAFAFGGITKASLWFAAHVANVRGAKLTLSDATNPAGYIDVARVGIGSYWEAPYAPTVLVATVVDTTENKRNGAGDLLSDRGTQHDHLTVELRGLSTTDRATMMRLARRCGKAQPVFLSGFPSSDDSVLEQDHMIYGKFAGDEGVPEDFYLKYIHKRDIEGW